MKWKKQFATFIQAYINYLKGEELDLTTIKILEEKQLCTCNSCELFYQDAFSYYLLSSSFKSLGLLHPLTSNACKWNLWHEFLHFSLLLPLLAARPANLTSFLSLHLFLCNTPPGAKKKRGVPFKIHVLCEARPSAYTETRTEDTPRETITWRILHIRPLYEDLVVFAQSQIRKIAYVVLLRSLWATEDVPRSLLGLRSSSFQPCFSATANKRFCLWC